jgi:hypothetical protein
MITEQQIEDYAVQLAEPGFGERPGGSGVRSRS